MISTNEIINRTARAGLQLQSEDGSMPSGYNGPWGDEETPLRNTSHWTVIFLTAYDLTDQTQYLDAAKNAVEYITLPKHRPGEATFHHRYSSRRDRCNGLIGQAWTIEALVTASQYFDRERLLALAKDTFLKHPFCSKNKIWKIVEIDGEVQSFDKTFNHQLWFSAAGALLLMEMSKSDLEHNQIQSQLHGFLNNIPELMRLTRGGYIKHGLLLGSFSLDQMKTRVSRFKRRTSLNQKSIGYHSFNLYAIAMIYEYLQGQVPISPTEFHKPLSLVETEFYRDAVEENPYSYSFNPTGFEIAYVASVFDIDIDEQYWIQIQLQKCYDFEEDLMSSETDDPMTLSARLYELTRIPNTTIPIE